MKKWLTPFKGERVKGEKMALKGEKVKGVKGEKMASPTNLSAR